MKKFLIVIVLLILLIGGVYLYNDYNSTKINDASDEILDLYDDYDSEIDEVISKIRIPVAAKISKKMMLSILIQLFLLMPN